MAINPESQYPGKINPSDSDYPYGSARNVTVPGDGTGTPWEAALVKDIMGLQQALLSAASIVPSGSPDTAGTSQYFDAILKTSGVNAIFADVSGMVSGVAANGATVVEGLKAAIGSSGKTTALTQAYSGTTGAARQILTRRSVVRSDISDGAWEPDGFGSQYLFGSSGDADPYVSILSGVSINDVRAYGAKGDGSTDDSGAIQSAIQSGAAIIFTDGVFAANSLQFDQPFTSYACRNASLKLNSSGTVLAEVKASGVRLYDMVFQGDELSVAQALVITDAGLTDLEFRRCTFKDIIGTTTSSQYGLFIRAYGSEAVVSDCIFKNIQSTNTTGTPTSAFCGGLILFGSGTYGPCRIKVNDCYFYDIFTNNISGNIDLSDADGLRVFTDQTIAEMGVSISSCHFVGVQKSAIKVSGSQGLSIDDIHVDATRADLPMIAAVRLQRSDRTSLTNVFIKGNLSRGLNIRSSKVSVDGLKYANSSLANNQMILVSVQSIDSSSRGTNDIQLNNVSGDLVFRAITLDDVNASGSTRVFSNISLVNWDVTPRNETSVMYQFLNAVDLTLDGVRLFDLQEYVNDASTFTDCDSVTINNCELHATRYAILAASTSGSSFNRSLLKSSRLFRNSNGSAESLRFVDIRTDPVGLNISDVKVRCPQYDSLTNTEAFILDVEDLSITDLSVVYEARGGTTRSVSALFIVGCQRGRINGYDFQIDNAAEETTQWAAILQNSDKVSVANVNSNSRGVSVEASCDNVFVDNVAANANVISNNATNPTTGTAVTWV